MRTNLYCTGFGFILAAALAIEPIPAAAQEMPPEILAVQIRSQGFACEKPLSAVRDKALSRPDQAAWILKCQNVTYRVRLNPGMAARVQRIN
ncbi:MAG: hypothetical protein RO009_03380 [Pseudorhodoplanes sp.]|jgi:hypothetical protein|nr:hypothetical protein [Pseudorhodoplanes sp.]